MNPVTRLGIPSVSSFGNFSSMPGENDMILRNVNTGGVEVYGRGFVRVDWEA
jgi:hypothetical protein